MALKETDYKSMLKETVMLKHVGSGPKDPAPKEKETKSPVEDSKGEGTQQSGTRHPNVIPPLAALKRDLAKEGIEIFRYKDEQLTEIVEKVLSNLNEEEVLKMMEERTLPQRIKEALAKLDK